jgi:hypothetical protein
LGGNGDYSLERRYITPFLAVWRVETGKKERLYIDAKSGEVLAIDDLHWQRAVKEANDTALEQKTPAIDKVDVPWIVDSISAIPEFDPYERLPWLTQSPLPSKELSTRLLQLLDKKARLRMTAEPYGEQLLMVWSVAGYQKWRSGAVYIAFHQDGQRYIPLETVLRNGRFYQ